MKYYDGMGRDVSDYVASLEQTVADLKAMLEYKMKEPTLNLASPEISSKFAYSSAVGIVETEGKPKPRRRTEQVANPE